MTTEQIESTERRRILACDIPRDEDGENPLKGTSVGWKIVRPLLRSLRVNENEREVLLFGKVRMSVRLQDEISEVGRLNE